MQSAVDAIAASRHPRSKVAACIAGRDAQGQSFEIARPNDWPPAIEQAFGQDTKIGNASGTVHAETACLLAAPLSMGASLYVTDPPCPNCMKNAAEAGIAALYIDHKGFDKDFARRRGHHFENMSMRIGEKSGINLYKINRKEGEITPIYKAPKDYKPPHENPAQIHKRNAGDSLSELIAETQEFFQDAPFALCLATNEQDETFSISAGAHPTIGYDHNTVEDPTGKYSFMLEPLNRLLMNAARHGLTIQNGAVYSSRSPTSRELVNFIGAGLDTIAIGAPDQCRDSDGLRALQQLQQASLLTTQIPR